MVVKKTSKLQRILSRINGRINHSIKGEKIKKRIVSLLLYGSLQASNTDEKSDVDIAVIVKTKTDKQKIEEIFTEDITDQFYEYFGVHLDTYVKTKDEFLVRLKKNLPPVSTLMQSYSIVYGKDPMDLK